MSDAPSAWRVEQAMAAWQSARARLLADDSGLEQNEAALDELLGDAEGDIESVLARLLRAARDAKAMAEASAGLIEDMRARKERYQRRNEAFRGTAFAILDALGRNRFEMPDITASIRAGQPSVQITNEDEIPDIYVELVRKIDKQTIASVLKSGGEVPGATLSNSLPTLSLRTK
jgi:DNA polymerase III delta prime subunit